MLEDIALLVKKPFFTDVSFKTIGLFFLLFIVVTIFAVDTLNILKEGVN